MKNILYTLLFTLVWSACTTGQNTKNNETFAVISIEGFQARPANAQLLDVRTPDESNSGIIEGSTLMNFHDEDFQIQLEALDKSRPVFVYCASGGRSNSALKMMQEMGFSAAYDLKGGMNAWSSAGKPVVAP